MVVLITKNKKALYKFVQVFEEDQNGEMWAILTPVKEEAKKFASKKEATAAIKKAGFKVSAFDFQPAL